jgi:hypothetical protein
MLISIASMLFIICWLCVVQTAAGEEMEQPYSSSAAESALRTHKLAGGE